MNAPFANMFIALQQRIQSQLPAIKYIDQDLGQLKASARPPVAWPCVLLDFEDFTFGNMGTNVQTACGTIVVRLGFAPFSGSSQLIPATWRDRAIGYYDLEWELHKALQGWSPMPEVGAMSRISVATQKRSDSYRVRELRYSIAFEDYSTKPTQQFVAPAMVVNDILDLPA